MTIIHDKLQPLGLSGSESIISFSTPIDRQLPMDQILEGDEKEDGQSEKEEQPKEKKK